MKIRNIYYLGIVVGLFVFSSCLPATSFAKEHKHFVLANSQSQSTDDGFWTPLTNQPNFVSYDLTNPNNPIPFPGGVYNPHLLTDGTIIVQNEAQYGWVTGQMWKLTPDIYGSYINGTWSQLPSLPDNYVPFAYASAVLQDGRLLMIGAEYNGWNAIPLFGNQGAIYDPISNSWSSITGPDFFVNFYPTYPPGSSGTSLMPIGDAASVILEDGTFMVCDKLSKQAALLDLKTMTWTETGSATKQYMNSEEGWTLLPNGKVLTVNTYKEYYINNLSGDGTFPYPFDLTQTEIYNPKTGEWSYGGSTIFPLSDTSLYSPNGLFWDFEMGPAILRPDGTVFALGSNGNSAIYDTKSKEWSQGPRLPSFLAPQYQLGIQDGPAALLPNGNVLFVASPLVPDDNFAPSISFFEFNGKEIVERPNIPNASLDASYFVSLLVLPTGQILSADQSNDVEIYTPSNQKYHPDWAPVIKRAPTKVRPGHTYKIRGIRFNGMSQASMYGDEGQCATNYPLVRITFDDTKHVYYCRTHDHSYMGVASNRKVHTYFDVPPNIESGKGKLEVVVNGIASKSQRIKVGAHKPKS